MTERFIVEYVGHLFDIVMQDKMRKLTDAGKIIDDLAEYLSIYYDVNCYDVWESCEKRILCPSIMIYNSNHHSHHINYTNGKFYDPGDWIQDPEDIVDLCDPEYREKIHMFLRKKFNE